MNVKKSDLIRFATRAPSGHNTQPWKFTYNADRISIYPDYTRRLPVVDSDDHALFISLGCALENLLVAAHHFGYQTLASYNLADAPTAHIKVKLVPSTLEDHSALFDAIMRRQSTRSEYTSAAIPERHLQKLAAAAADRDVICSIVVDKEQINQLTGLIKEGAVRQFNNSRFKAELLRWIRFDEKAANQTKDGLRAACMGNPTVPTWLGRLIFRYTVTARSEAEKAAKMAQSSAALLLFSVKRNDREAWVRLGQSFERVALQATALGIKHAHLNMPCEELIVREKLKNLMGFTTQEPLLLIRIGYADPLPYSYRRPVEAVVYHTVSQDQTSHARSLEN